MLIYMTIRGDIIMQNKFMTLNEVVVKVYCIVGDC